MDSATNLIIPTVLSIISAFITSLITHKLTYSNDVKRIIHDERKSLYFKLFSEIDKLLSNHMLVFDSSYIQTLKNYKPSIKLMASDKVVSAYKDLYEFVGNKYSLCIAFINKNDPRKDMRNYEFTYDDNGDEILIPHIIDSDIQMYENYLEQFKRDNAPSYDEIEKYVQNIYTRMRKDLKSDLR